MPPPFQRLSLPQFAAVLQAFTFTRRITAVHMHRTWRPDRSMWRGATSMEGMWRSHTQVRGFSDIAQHLTIDPEGFAWTGRHWNQAPASAVGHNGNGVAGPFMFEVVGNFDKGCDSFDGAQRHAVLDVAALVQRHFGLDAEALLFHSQVAAKTCPGTSIDRAAFVVALGEHVPSTTAARSRSRRTELADEAVVRRALQGSKAVPARSRSTRWRRRWKSSTTSTNDRRRHPSGGHDGVDGPPKRALVHGSSLSLKRCSLPVLVRGSASTKATARGYL